jgi:hypothetical protein
MKGQKWIMFFTALALMVGSAGLLGLIHNNQKLGVPGVKTHPLQNSIRLAADLPAHVLDYTSQETEIDEMTFKGLPADTSFGHRRYRAPDGFGLDLRVVLMGYDRTSLHKPQFCLTCQGWQIDQTIETTIAMDRPVKYDLPVIELIATRTENGQRTAERAIFVYWYVADDGLSGSAVGLGRMWQIAEKMIRTGTLQRWAYVSCFTFCAPGREDATFDRIKQFLAASVPEFQLNPKPPGQTLSAKQ